MPLIWFCNLNVEISVGLVNHPTTLLNDTWCYNNIINNNIIIIIVFIAGFHSMYKDMYMNMDPI